MKKLITLATVLFTLIFASISNAEFKKYYYTDDNNYHINTESVKEDAGSGLRYAWVKWEFGKPAEFNGISVMEIRMVADCSANKKLKSIEAIAYDANTVELVHENHSNELVLAPNTANLATYEKICESEVKEQIKPAKKAKKAKKRAE